MKNLKKMKWLVLALAGLTLAGAVMTVDAADVSSRTENGSQVRRISSTPWEGEEPLPLTDGWDKTFPKSGRVDHEKVTFHNRYGITLAADLYMPKNRNGKMAALAVAGPFGAVKEQASGLYAQKLAEMGFLTIAFDPSFIGESGGMANGYFDYEKDGDTLKKERMDRRKALNQQRTEDYKNGSYKRDGGVVDPLPADAPQFVKDYYDYYKTKRGYHPRSLNSNDGWNVTSALSFTNMPLLAYADEIESPVLIIHGEKAHSRYFSEDAFKKLKGNNKELLIVPGANHTDMYDNMDKIPFHKIAAFFHKYLG